MSDMSRSLSFRVHPTLLKELRRLCRRQNRAASDVAREALRRYLVTERLDEVRRKLRPHAKAAGLLTDEDFFKAIS
jgi:predicted transcriptional regulator